MTSGRTDATKDRHSHVPDFDDPYPEPGWKEITDFEYRSPLVLYRSSKAVRYRGGRRDADYIVAVPYTVSFKLDDTMRSLTVPKGMLTDLASVPPLARSIVGRVGPHLEAAIVHDFLYIAWQDVADRNARRADRAFADKLMRVAMRTARVRPCRRNLIYGAIRAGGWWAYRRRDEPPRYCTVPDGAVGEPDSTTHDMKCGR